MSLPPELPRLYATEYQEDPTVWACYLHPLLRWAWFATEYDGERLFFGLVHGFADEMGYFDRLELEAVGAYLDPAGHPSRSRRSKRPWRKRWVTAISAVRRVRVCPCPGG